MASVIGQTASLTKNGVGPQCPYQCISRNSTHSTFPTAGLWCQRDIILLFELIVVQTFTIGLNNGAENCMSRWEHPYIAKLQPLIQANI